MIVKLFKCQMCGERFEVECLDRQDPRERHVQGCQITCPKCHSPSVEEVKVLRRTAG